MYALVRHVRCAATVGNCLEGVGVGGASLKSISDFAICHEISFHNATAAAAQVPARGGAEWEGGKGCGLQQQHLRLALIRK